MAGAGARLQFRLRHHHRFVFGHDLNLPVRNTPVKGQRFCGVPLNSCSASSMLIGRASRGARGSDRDRGGISRQSDRAPASRSLWHLRQSLIVAEAGRWSWCCWRPRDRPAVQLAMAVVVEPAVREPAVAGGLLGRAAVAVDGPNRSSGNVVSASVFANVVAHRWEGRPAWRRTSTSLDGSTRSRFST